jgi:hypothetical protein
MTSGSVHSHVPRPGRAAPVCMRRGRCTPALKEVAVILGIIGVAADGLDCLPAIGVVLFVAAVVFVAVRGSRRTKRRPRLLRGPGSSAGVQESPGQRGRVTGGLRHHFRVSRRTLQGGSMIIPCTGICAERTGRPRPGRPPSPVPLHRPACPCPRRPKPLVATGIGGRHAAYGVIGSLGRSAMQACAGRQRRATLIAADCLMDPRGSGCALRRGTVSRHTWSGRRRLRRHSDRHRPAPAAVRRSRGTGPPGEHRVDTAAQRFPHALGTKGSRQR